MRPMTLVRCGIAVVSVALCGLLEGTAWAGEGYRPRVLFSLTYGSGAREVGVAPGDAAGKAESGSLFGVRAPGDGSVWVWDRVQRRVKRFDEHGNLLLVVDSAYQRPDIKGTAELCEGLGFPHDFAVSPGGRLAVIHDAGGPEVALFDPGGLQRRGASEMIAATVQEAAPDIHPLTKVFILDMDRDGSLYLHVGPAKNDYNVDLVKLDANLKLLGVRPGFMVGWDGRTYGFAPNRAPEPNDQLRVYSPDGELERVVVLQPPPGTAAGDYDEATHRWRAVSDALFDATGAVYLVYERELPEDEAVELQPNFRITTELAIYKFGSDGQFLLQVVFRGLPFDMCFSVAVDPQGNLYHLEYYADRVDFVKEEVVADGAEASGRPNS